MKLHEKFRIARELKHWSQECVAEKLGISVSCYAKIERGETKTIHSHFKKIVELFQLDLMDLLSDKESNVVCSFNENNILNESSLNKNSLNNNNDEDTEVELKMNQLTIEHLKDKLTQKETEIANLHEIIRLLKEK
ncbi:MAG: helix-turn-helix transcriptional regulator [Methylococcales bacterium]|nr:helix-turn-helix transcriptional regulator [Methylococcales bacterium]